VVFGAPEVVLLDLPQLTEDQPQHRPFIAAHAVPWPGEMAVFRSPSTDGFELLTTFGGRARIGTLVSDFYAGPTYHPSRHIESARDEKITPDPERFVAAHVRRLEALRRAGIVERWGEDHWKVPQDLSERGLVQDRKGHGPGARMEMLSPVGLDKQVTHDGATWLDNELMRQGSPNLREAGFGAEMKRAIERRKQVLVQGGDVQDLGEGRIRAPRDLVQRLEAREIDRVGRTMAADRGRDWTPIKPGSRFGGELVGSTQLPSGRFAMIDNGLGFSLVPWNDALERRLSQQIAVVGLPGGGVDWAFGQSRGLGL
jgi:hypothetical protein